MMTKTIAGLALLAGLGFVAPVLATELKVQSFNIWGGGANEGKSVDETVTVLKAVGADIIGIQETRLEADPCTADVCPAVGTSVAKAIADALGYYYVDQTATNDALWANAILSRFPIGPMTPNGLGVSVEVEGRKVEVFNIHLDDSPYQPYQLTHIPYGDSPFLKTEDEAVAAATATRGKALDLLEADMKATGDADLMLVFGDFNEPSDLDWTDATAAKGTHPIKVAFPTTRRIESWGFVDMFRAVFPDPVAKPGFTWTPTTADTDPEDHHDRIDFTFGRAAALKVLEAGIVGEKMPEADIVVTPWPSDHRSSYARLAF
ncbi:endonuclease/exonuclease/phosphatase family protein [Devosia sp.]|uniref:endonuclease/exonuclease/phosphatase family protein n=1 Tax=Devosia sp. TaxID=1871048 RepID=UPI003BAA148A